MGRELRMVPANWEHPKRSNGNYEPLLDGFNKDLAEWREGKAKWGDGLVRSYPDKWKAKPDYTGDSYEEWAGHEPDESDYMPDFPQEQRTHFQMYQNTSEGTPISPVCETAEQLARWLADNKASAFGDMTATYEQWLATINAGYAVSAAYSTETGFVSGVALNEK